GSNTFVTSGDTDQRGLNRIVNGTVDIGAFEVQTTAAKASTSTALTVGTNPSVFSQSVTFTATVAGTGGTPTGSVSFMDGTATLGTLTLSAGKATFATAGLAVGPHTITALYSGDTGFNGSTSAAVIQTISFANIIVNT